MLALGHEFAHFFSAYATDVLGKGYNVTLRTLKGEPLDKTLTIFNKSTQWPGSSTNIEEAQAVEFTNRLTEIINKATQSNIAPTPYSSADNDATNVKVNR